MACYPGGHYCDCYPGALSSIHIGSGNGLVPSGNKALPEQAITQTNVDPDLCHHIMSQGHSELKLQMPQDFTRCSQQF